MPLFEASPGLREALSGEMTPKFLATRTTAGVPNVVPVISILPSDDEPDTVFFGNFLLRKSIQNLKQDARVGILVVTPELRGWILTGDFVEFQRTGKYVDRQMGGSLLRYNAYTGIRDAGVIRVRSVTGSFALSKLRVLREFVLARLAASRTLDRASDSTCLPLPVKQEFQKMTAVKVIAWLGHDGYPALAPALSLQPAGDTALACWQGAQRLPLAAGALVAANLLSLEAISYQVKGRWAEAGRCGVVQVEEVYAGGPPYPGGRVA